MRLAACGSPTHSCTSAFVGGRRAWPLAGFFSDGVSAAINRCPEPAAERCTGWSEGMAAVQCGHSYRQGSPGCGTCSAGWYRSLLTAACVLCPNVDDTWTLIQLPLAFVGGIAALGLLIFAVLLVVRHFRGGTVAEYGRRSAKFVAQVFVAVQVVVSMRGAAQAGLPPVLQSLYGWLGALQVRGARWV